jgi:alpha-methylacyl-CoA racemase
MGKGPLSGLRVVEFAGVGPAPFCALMLSDAGADVVRIDRDDGVPGLLDRLPTRTNILSRGRRSVALDLKRPEAIEACLTLLEKADVVIESFRPGVMERLGLGPETALARNPKLIYGRVSGWGQDGPYAQLAGHDLNYIAITGVLHSIGTPEKPVPPVNVVGDFGGGAMFLAFGVLAALLHARAAGVGQVVDCSMSEGSASLLASVYGLKAAGTWSDNRGTNRLDGGAHYYDTYQCADGKWVSVAPIESKFYAQLIERLGVDDPGFASQSDPARWPEMKARFAAVFATRSRDEWCEVMAGADACFAPVLDLGEAPRHPHNVARGVFTEVEGVVQPAPAPRFSRTPGEIQGAAPAIGAHNREALADWGVPQATIDAAFPAAS